MDTNRQAFLDMIAQSEGTASVGHKNGYDVLVGSKPGRMNRIDSFDRHPRITIEWGDGPDDWSSAAGRYQIIWLTWSRLIQKIGLRDFSPAEQDRAAIELITERGAIQYIDKGEISDAIAACAPEWASLPGAGYGQHENKLYHLLSLYQRAGGHLA